MLITLTSVQDFIVIGFIGALSHFHVDMNHNHSVTFFFVIFYNRSQLSAKPRVAYACMTAPTTQYDARMRFCGINVTAHFLGNYSSKPRKIYPIEWTFHIKAKMLNNIRTERDR